MCMWMGSVRSSGLVIYTCLRVKQSSGMATCTLDLDRNQAIHLRPRHASSCYNRVVRRASTSALKLRRLTRSGTCVAAWLRGLLAALAEGGAVAPGPPTPFSAHTCSLATFTTLAITLARTSPRPFACLHFCPALHSPAQPAPPPRPAPPPPVAGTTTATPTPTPTHALPTRMRSPSAARIAAVEERRP